MIKKVFLSLVLGVFLVSLIGFVNLVSAECDDNQTILRLYNQNNSHAQVWDFGDGRCVDIGFNYDNYCGYGHPDGVDSGNTPIGDEISCIRAGSPCEWKSGSKKCVVDPTKIRNVDCSAISTLINCNKEVNYCEWQSGLEYDYEVCYDEIFGASYLGAEPHPETCDNPVLWLQDYTNSHASVPYAIDLSGSLWSEINKTYTIPVCFGDLVCRYTEDDACGPKEKLVVRLYDHSENSENVGLAGMNSHVSNAEDENYNVRVCCKSGVEVTGAEWQNLYGQKINDTDLNDTVKLVASGIGLDKAGTKFIITKKRGDGIFDIFIPDKRIDTLTSTTGIATWRAEQSGKYKFKAILSSTNEKLESGILNVSSVINDTPPVIEILSPQCNLSHFLGELSIALQLDDPDDYINGTLDLGDGTRIEVDNSKGDIFTYLHNYTTSGNMHIELLTLNERSRTIKRVSNIMVINGDVPGMYLAACVDQPEDLSFIPDAEVRFIARTTRAIDYLPGTGITELDIEDVLKESWTFSDFRNITRTNLGYDFTYVFSSPGPNWAELTVEFV